MEKDGVVNMVKFKEIKRPDTERLKKRVVDYVCEYRMKSLFGELINWRGSTETEYFSIIFIKGVLTASVEEREMLLGTTGVNVAMSQKLADMFMAAKTELTQTEAALEYNRKHYKKEFDEASFTDVMVLLDWKYAPNAKVDYDMLGVDSFMKM